MQSKASYFSISRPLMIENMRRFWAIPALGFLVYFLSGVFPLLMSYAHLNRMASYIEMSLNNQQPFYVFAHLLFPILTAVIMFRYLQGISSVSVIHSMPFTRAKLYQTGFVSGLIMILAPILANGLILLAISKPAYREYGTSEGLMLSTINVFSRIGVLNWIWISVVIVAVIYAISIFAGMITGNPLMHFATAGFFNFIIPGLFGVFIAYFSHYLYGFDSTGNWIEICMKISPILNVLQNGSDFGLLATLYYLLNILVLYLLSGYLYQKRKLERATDSLVFGFMEPVICYLIAFLGMTLLGFYFDVLGEEEFYLYAGFAAGTIIFFILGQMIVKKTPRIYNLQSLKNFGVYVLIAVVFIAGLFFDVTGFEKRVPDAQQVTGFTVQEDFSRNYNYNSSVYGYNYDSKHAFVMKDPENIKAMIGLHQSIIADRNQFKDPTDYLSSSIKFAYNPGAILPMNRRYTIDYDFYAKSKELKQIYESAEFKNYYSMKNLNYEKLNSIQLSTDYPYGEAVLISDQTEMKAFIDCLSRDFQAKTFEDIVSLQRNYAVADISFTYKDKESNTPERAMDTSFSYKISPNDKNTIQWLQDHGLNSKLELDLNDVESIEMVHYVSTGDEDESTAYLPYEEVSVHEENELKTMEIRDQAKIQELLSDYDSQYKNYRDYYYGIVYFKETGQYQQNYYTDDYEQKMYEDKMTSDSPVMRIYFNDAIPEYVLDYFGE